jgi:hypothetical protein
MEKTKKRKRKTFIRRDFLKEFGSGALSTTVVPSSSPRISILSGQRED